MVQMSYYIGWCLDQTERHGRKKTNRQGKRNKISSHMVAHFLTCSILFVYDIIVVNTIAIFLNYLNTDMK